MLERLLETIRQQTVPFADVVVVDNHSTDSGPDVARRFGCRVMAMERNMGFARAVNTGWRTVTTPWVAILNSDVELDPGWVDRLLAAVTTTIGADRNFADASFATGTIFDAARRTVVDGTYDLVTRGACAWRAGNGDPLGGGSLDSAEIRRIAIAPGTACLYRREVLERMGGFAESFGSYLEDVDLGLRCLKAGLTGIYVPEAVAWHHGSATLGRWNPRVVRLISRNQVLLVSRHYDKALLRSCWWPILAGQVLWGLVALRHGAAMPWMAGKWDALRTFRLEGEPNAGIRDFFSSSESEIHRTATGAYWRWYFRLTNGKFPAVPPDRPL